MPKNSVASYFSFTKKERIGIIALITLIIFFILLPFLFPFFIKQKMYNHSAFEKDIASLQPAGQDSSYSPHYNDEDNYQPTYYKQRGQTNGNDETKTGIFNFDPNTLDEAGWKKLGVKDKTVQTIQKYLSKGGRFKSPQDISKIWGLSEQMVQHLMPYIQIAQTDTTAKKQYPTYTKTLYKKEIIAVDVNTADTTAFIALPGIGNKLANRIVTFRNKLGGFYKTGQVAETFGLPDSTFQLIKPRLVISSTTVKQININTATVDEMKPHPYIRYYIANAIVQYRLQHGNFSSVDDIKKIALVTEEAFAKMAPYLKVN